MTLHARIDHLVLAARSLDEGVRWCEATFGVVPGPGGIHPLMGTHNRLLRIGSAANPRAYFEIIAIDPRAAAHARGAGTRRWFDLDDTELQASLARHGPRLVHFVVEVPDITDSVRRLAGHRIDRGQVIEASRDTPAGRLSWRITVRDDGQRLFYGALPTLIEWGPVHPVDSMGESGVVLRTLDLSHPRADVLVAALRTIGLSGMTPTAGPPNLRAHFDSPLGPVSIESGGV